MIDGLRKTQGEPFWIELTHSTFEALCHAADLDAASLAALIRRSRSLCQKLLSAEVPLTDPVQQIFSDKYCLWSLKTNRGDHLPLCQLTARSVSLLRVGRSMTRKELSEASGVSADFIKSLELSRRFEVATDKRLALGLALGVQLFML